MNSRVKNLTGKTFGRLTVVRFVGVVGRHSIWECNCGCGKTKIVKGYNLRDGRTFSCGCYAKEQNRIRMLRLVSNRKPRQLAWIRDIACIRCVSHKPDNQGYPRIKRGGRGGKMTSIARIIMLRRFPSASSLHARHACDNPWCINPEHIVPGTHLDNMQDRNERGRTAKGEAISSQLTNKQVLEIKRLLSLGHLQKSIAERFGVSNNTIGHIKTGRSWSHIKQSMLVSGV